MNKGKHESFLIQDFKQGLNINQVLSYIQKHHFCLFELDKETKETECMKTIELEAKVIQFRTNPNVEFRHLAIIVNKIGDDKFKDEFRRDSDHVWPKALSKKCLNQIGLDKIEEIRRFTKEFFQKDIHVKLVIQKKERR